MNAPVKIEVVDLYAARKRIHPRLIKGTFQQLRSGIRIVLMGLFFALPWVPWGDRPAVWLDATNRKFYLFDAVIWPQDFALAFVALIIGAYGLFAVTNFVGRAFCGYACPQSVWFGTFIWLEALVEGNERQRRKLDARPWDAYKLRVRGTKYLVFSLLAAATGFTAVAYLITAPELTRLIFTGTLGGWNLFWFCFFFFATIIMGGFMREQVCTYMCPYARFQSAMFDSDTLIVSYDAGRGEPRGGRRRDAKLDEIELGACVDCQRCVQVCPVGIDIRDGLQYQCISCALCIDACDEVMDQMNYPRGLVRYTTENALAGDEYRLLRPRLIGYAIALVFAMSAFVYVFFTRPPIEVDVIRPRDELYHRVEHDDGASFENTYLVRIYNKTEAPHSYTMALDGADGLAWLGPKQIDIPAGDQGESLIRLATGTIADAPATGGVPQFRELRFRVTREDGETADETSRFIQPAPR